MLEQEKQTFISKEQSQRMPTYIVKFPENKSDLTEIDCLGLNNRARNALLRNNITKISVLSSLSDEYLLSEIRWFGPKSLLEVRTKLEDFRQKLIEKQVETPGKPIVIEISLPKSKREEKFCQKWAPLVNFIKTWQEEHPGRRGAQNAATKVFRISRERVSKILAHYPHESFKPKGVISLSQLAHQLETKPRTIINLLRQSKVSLGNEKIDEFYRSRVNSHSVIDLRRIPVSSVDMNKLKNELTKPQWLMECLTISIAKRHKDTFIPLSNLTRQANMGNPREISRVYNELATAGFHLKKIPFYKYAKSCCYFAYSQEASAIITYLQEKHHLHDSRKNSR